MRHSVVFLFALLCVLFSSACAASSKKSYGKHKVISYVVDWEVPKKINWSKLDHVAYAFAEPDKTGSLKSFTSSTLKSFTAQAHKHHVGVSISVGGWSGSKYFSSLVASNSKRKTLVNNIVKMVQKYKLDGVNLDWEYPNDPNGVSCNQRNPKDTANYLKMVQLLRKSLDAKYPKVHKLITIAAGTNPFNDEKQHPIKKLNSGWVRAVDSFYIMTYDVSGSWMSHAGPNAPLKQASKYDSSVMQAVKVWNKAGIPNKKIVIGIPFYGSAVKTSRSITSSSGPYVKLASKSGIRGDKYDELSADACPGAKKAYSGSVQWRSIVEAGVMKNKNGWKSHWDHVSGTPYAFQRKANKYLTFDNVKSIKSKVAYAKKHNLGGAMVWSLEMDDKKNTLLNSLQGMR